MYEVKLRVMVTNIRDNVATGEIIVNSINKDIINKCSSIFVHSGRLINYWQEGVALHRQQKIMSRCLFRT